MQHRAKKYSTGEAPAETRHFGAMIPSTDSDPNCQISLVRQASCESGDQWWGAESKEEKNLVEGADQRAGLTGHKCPV